METQATGPTIFQRDAQSSAVIAGTISFDELDRQAAAALEKFRVMSLMNYSSVEHMWKAVFFCTAAFKLCFCTPLIPLTS